MIPLSVEDVALMESYGITNVYDIPSYARRYNDPDLVVLWGKVSHLNFLHANGVHFE